MDSPENNKRQIILSTDVSSAASCQNNSEKERRQRSSSGKRLDTQTGREKKDRKSSTTHDGRGSELF